MATNARRQMVEENRGKIESRFLLSGQNRAVMALLDTTDRNGRDYAERIIGPSVVAARLARRPPEPIVLVDFSFDHAIDLFGSVGPHILEYDSRGTIPVVVVAFGGIGCWGLPKPNDRTVNDFDPRQ